jgi:GNAT superfamily N-acetyltransferase
MLGPGSAINRRMGAARIWMASGAEAGTVAALLADFRSHFGKSEPSDASMRRSVERIMGADAGEYLLAAGPTGDAAGVCQLRYRWSVWTEAEDCWLEDLFVREAFRGAGLGRALVHAAMQRARERGCRRIELDVNEDNAAALALYESCGFSREPKPPGRTLFVARRLD